MIICLCGGTKLLSKILPVSKLTSRFLIDQVTATTQAISSGGGKVKAIICDGNRTNQSFFKRHKMIPEKTWLTEDGKYLLFDNPHILKWIRNLWLTEKTGELEYNDNGVKRTARCLDIKRLHQLESKQNGGNIVKMSMLDDVSVYPRQIERKKYRHIETYNALLIHPCVAADPSLCG